MLCLFAGMAVDPATNIMYAVDSVRRPIMNMMIMIVVVAAANNDDDDG